MKLSAELGLYAGIRQGDAAADEVLQRLARGRRPGPLAAVRSGVGPAADDDAVVRDRGAQDLRADRSGAVSAFDLERSDYRARTRADDQVDLDRPDHGSLSLEVAGRDPGLEARRKWHRSRGGGRYQRRAGGRCRARTHERDPGEGAGSYGCRNRNYCRSPPETANPRVRVHSRFLTPIESLRLPETRSLARGATVSMTASAGMATPPALSTARFGRRGARRVKPGGKMGHRL